MKIAALLILLAAACVPARAYAQPARTAALTELRGRLDRLRASRATEPERNGGDVDVAPLVGMTRAEIRRALGEPYECGGPDAMHDPQGNWVPTAPCETREDWFYSFYRLPPRSLGGGPELLLQFDRAGVCTRAVWRYSR